MEIDNPHKLPLPYGSSYIYASHVNEIRSAMLKQNTAILEIMIPEDDLYHAADMVTSFQAKCSMKRLEIKKVLYADSHNIYRYMMAIDKEGHFVTTEILEITPVPNYWG